MPKGRAVHSYTEIPLPHRDLLVHHHKPASRLIQVITYVPDIPITATTQETPLA